MRKGIEESLNSALRKAGMDQVPPDVKGRIVKYMDEVAEWSGKMHLVGRNGTQSNLELLLLDSILLLKTAEESELMAAGEPPGRIADIGSGAGFPGLVWKILSPRADVTLFERRTKPQLFLERTISLLDLSGVSVVGQDVSSFRGAGSFELAVSKAAGRLGTVLPLAERLLVSGGAYLTIKGHEWRGELSGRPSSAMRFDSARELPEGRGYALIFRK